jgi:hypothetical protein
MSEIEAIVNPLQKQADVNKIIFAVSRASSFNSSSVSLLINQIRNDLAKLRVRSQILLVLTAGEAIEPVDFSCTPVGEVGIIKKNEAPFSSELFSAQILPP